jgi:hypothetical protein
MMLAQVDDIYAEETTDNNDAMISTRFSNLPQEQRMSYFFQNFNTKCD